MVMAKYKATVGLVSKFQTTLETQTEELGRQTDLKS